MRKKIKFWILAVIATQSFNGWAEDVAPEKTEAEGLKEFTVTDPPSITIGKETISSFNPYAALKKEGGMMPESLQNPEFQKQLKNKIYIKPFDHSPQTGVPYAPIEIIEFMDLGCGKDCVETMQKLSKLQERHPQEVKLTHIYMPASEGINMVNFYGKIAQNNDVFWPYREHILSQNISEGTAALEALLDLDVPRAAIRLSARRDAGLFYKELDQDKFLAEKLELKHPPHLFVNGIHVGEGGIPLDKLEDVILYELMQLKQMGF